MKKLNILSIVIILLSGVLTESGAQQRLLGKVNFPNSGSGDAQKAFIEGLLFLHNFEYRDAALSFREAQEADPDFMMAYWGEAMTKNQPIWFRQQREEAIEVLNKLAPTPEERQQVEATRREKDYLHAVELLFGTVEETAELSKEERDVAYREEMKKIHERYPDDHEARSFYALSMLGTAHEGRDFKLYMQTAAVLMPVWNTNKKHPGAAHYLIHSFDDPIHAPLGLPMAEAYSEIAPDAAHAQHMTSHIFTALGLWERVVHANERASEVEIRRELELGEPTTVCGHNRYWLVYGYLQQGRDREAEKLIETCHVRVSDSRTDSNLWHFAMMKARYVIDTEQWNASERWVISYSDNTSGAAGYYFTEAYSAIQKNDYMRAKSFTTNLQEIHDRNPSGELEVMITELNGLIRLDEDGVEAGIRELRRAAEMKSELPLDYGPPTVIKPAHELLGETLLMLNRYEEAAEAFRKQLYFSPRRTNTMEKLADVLERLGEHKEVSELRDELNEIYRKGREASSASK